MKKKILIALACILSVIIAVCKIYIPNEKIINELGQVENTVIEEVREENKHMENNISTTEIPKATIDEEETLEIQEVESESFELQGNIAYEGDAKTWTISTGNTPQLTYISQIDSRWRYYPYTSIGDSSQTIGSSGCGVASAAMIIDSIVGNVSVTELADTFVKNGYRSANSGTYWSAYRAIADEFNIEYTETSNYNTMLNLLKNSNYIIASCGNGLFTSNGHYIVIYGVEGNTLKIYDPYLYAGKFETSTRRGKVSVNGNTVYCSIDNFGDYANYRQFFCYKYDTNKVITSNSTDNSVTTEMYTRYVATKSSNLNVRSSPGGIIVDSLSKGTQVTVYDTSENWSRIGNDRWVSSVYLSSDNPNDKIKQLPKYTTGTYKVTASLLHVRTGPGKNYKIKTYSQLTSNARAQNRKLGNNKANGYIKGITCTVTQINGNWGKTASGWICLDYCKRKY